jgi:hypothetical protein
MALIKSILVYCFRLLLRYELGLAALALWLLHKWLGLPLIIFRVMLCIWLLEPLVFDLIVRLASKSNQPRRRKNGEEKNYKP